MPKGIYDRTPPITRFMRRVQKTEGCWFWLGGLTANGYGQFWWNAHGMRAHRFSYLHFKGQIPAGLFVLHSCDVRNCVNPAHLWLGTLAENQQDAISKGRAHKATGPNPLLQGERQHNHKLTEAQVREIRRLHNPQRNSGCGTRNLAKRFGVTHYAIFCIVKRITWAHLSDSL